MDLTTALAKVLGPRDVTPKKIPLIHTAIHRYGHRRTEKGDVGEAVRPALVAPPAFLGDLREKLPKDLKDKFAGDVASHFTNAPEQDLYTHLKDILDRAA